MSPQEKTPLVAKSSDGDGRPEHGRQMFLEDDDNYDAENAVDVANGFETHPSPMKRIVLGFLMLLFAVGIGLVVLVVYKIEHGRFSSNINATGPYRLVEAQSGAAFFNAYEFYVGADTLGSAGYNTYVSEKIARDKLRIANVTTDDDGKQFIYMGSAPTQEGPRDSIRLEGKRRYNHGLFILDVRHMPNGCGQWPAWWLSDDDKGHWPGSGEIDVLEGINGQGVAKTALHTRKDCSMYAHVPPWAHTGMWDTATGIPNTFTGKPDYEVKVNADNCWEMAPHQWYNQGCVQLAEQNDTLGAGVNDAGGGVYVLELDPTAHYIRSWVFVRPDIPHNLQKVLESATVPHNSGHTLDVVTPDTSDDSWGLPYAYFAIGDTTGCSADHFRNLRVVFDLAFCGTVAGNRFARDCPNVAAKFNESNDPVASCNAYIKSNPGTLAEAYWKIGGVYIFQRQNH